VNVPRAGVTGLPIFSSKGQSSGLDLWSLSAVYRSAAADGRTICPHWADTFSSHVVNIDT